MIMVGNFADVDTAEKRAKINQVTKWYKPWFYKHVEGFLKKVNHAGLMNLDFLHKCSVDVV